MMEFQPLRERAMELRPQPSGFTRLIEGARKLSNITVGTGQVNIANVISLLGVAAVIWFGSLVTGDHEKINQIANSVGNLASIEAQIGTTNTLITGFQAHQLEIDQRLDCLQGVGTVEQGCRIPAQRGPHR